MGLMAESGDEPENLEPQLMCSVINGLTFDRMNGVRLLDSLEKIPPTIERSIGKLQDSHAIGTPNHCGSRAGHRR